jgi:hypothetical protein
VNLNLIINIIFAIISMLFSIISTILYYKARFMIEDIIKSKNFASKDSVEDLKESIEKLSDRLDKIYELLIKRG